MYGKIFESIYDGTLYGQWEAIVTFEQFIILADDQGVVDMTPPAISARTSIPLDIIEKGIKILESEDPYTRTPGNEGRRIELMDGHRPWGWKIVNYGHYRRMASYEDKRKADRDRMAKKREESKNSNESSDVANSRGQSQPVEEVAKVAYTDTDTDNNNTAKSGDLTTLYENPEFQEFWKNYPRKEKKKRAALAFKKLTKKQKQFAIKDCKSRFKDTDPKYIPLPATYINDAPWDDDKPQVKYDPSI